LALARLLKSSSGLVSKPHASDTACRNSIMASRARVEWPAPNTAQMGNANIEEQLLSRKRIHESSNPVIAKKCELMINSQLERPRTGAFSCGLCSFDHDVVVVKID